MTEGKAPRRMKSGAIYSFGMKVDMVPRIRVPGRIFKLGDKF